LRQLLRLGLLLAAKSLALTAYCFFVRFYRVNQWSADFQASPMIQL
jgi:hypothetical protein